MTSNRIWTYFCSILCLSNHAPCHFLFALQGRHNERDGFSNHRRLDCLLNRMFMRRSKKTSKLRVTGLCEGKSPHKGPVTRKIFSFDAVIMECANRRDLWGEFSAQRASNAENVSIWWRHHVMRKPDSNKSYHTSISRKTVKRLVENGLVWLYCRKSRRFAHSMINTCHSDATSKIRKIFTGATYKLLLSFKVTSDLYMSFIPNKTAVDKYSVTHWISKLPGSFEIQWVRQCLVKFTGLAGRVNTPVYRTEPIFTGLGHGKLFESVLIVNTCYVQILRRKKTFTSLRQTTNISVWRPIRICLHVVL